MFDDLFGLGILQNCFIRLEYEHGLLNAAVELPGPLYFASYRRQVPRFRRIQPRLCIDLGHHFDVTRVLHEQLHIFLVHVYDGQAKCLEAFDQQQCSLSVPHLVELRVHQGYDGILQINEFTKFQIIMFFS